MNKPMTQLADFLGIQHDNLPREVLAERVCSAALSKIKELNKAVLEEIEIRDSYHETADMLANEISKFLAVDIGEHSNCNNPWDNAIEAIPTSNAIAAIITERTRQDEKWGGPEHDDQHSLSEFADFIQKRAISIYWNDRHGNKVEARRRLVQIAALAVAATELCDRMAERGHDQ